MTLPLDDHGLPLPGRELDRFIAINVLGLVPGKDWCEPCFDQLFCDRPLSRYSTTHAFFQVMEQFKAKGWDIDFFWDDRHLIAHLHFCQLNGVEWEYATVRIPWRDTIEETYAHAVCCCAWLAMGGENA